MNKAKMARVDQLLDALDAGKVKKDFNIVEDLTALKESLGMFKIRDVSRRIEKLIKKYSAGEAAEIHAALIARCRTGDVGAIRLYNEMQQADGTSEEASNNLLEAIMAVTGGKR